MDKTEMESIVNALDRINRSLDERFEKNADLYIAPEQVEKLKRLIYLGNYQQIVKECTLKKYSAEVLANVLVKNAWLMRRNSFALLQPIFEECNYDYLKSVMYDGVFDNKIDMPPQFRLQLIFTFLKKGDSAMCQKMLEQKLLFLNHPKLKAICLRQALKDEPITERYRRFNYYVEKNRNILTQESILAPLFPSEEFTDELRLEILKKHIINQASGSWHFWIMRFGKADIPFIMRVFKRFCRMHSSDLSACKKLIGALYPLSRSDFKTFADKFADACTCMDGDDKKIRLAEGVLNRLEVGSSEETILQAALARRDIKGIARSSLADMDTISELLSQDSTNYYKKAANWLATSFDNQYYNDCEDRLDELGQVVPQDRFEDFCLLLVKGKFSHLRYLIYAIEKLIPAVDENDALIRALLKHIEDKNILQRNIKDPNISKVVDFVRTNDFDLFCRLKQF